METIKQYYRLCSINDEKPNPVYNQIDEKVMNAIIGKKHIELYLKKDAKGYIVKENVIGAKQKTKLKNKKPILIF